MPQESKASLGDYLAAERTFLAWIRTGLALMGFGFVVARFGFFLQELRIAQHIPVAQSYGSSTWFGTALVVAGVFVVLISGWQQARLVRRLDRGDIRAGRPVVRALALAIFLTLFGLAMAVYLIAVHGSAKSEPQSLRKDGGAWHSLKITESPIRRASTRSTRLLRNSRGFSGPRA